MNIIVAVDKKWAIGKNNRLLVSIPQDMKYFRETTRGKVVVMGRRTLESFPEGKPLKGRTNIVLTRNEQFQKEGTTVVHSVDELLAEVKQYAPEDVFVIGGEAVYRELLPYCDKAYVTRIDKEYDADTHFPDLDQDKEWRMTKETDEQTYFDLLYIFTIYERVK